MALSAGQIMEYGEKKALSTITGTTQSAVTTYLALPTAAPATGADLTMASETEFATTGGGYARQPFLPGTPTSAAPSVLGNSATITFGPMTIAPGTTTWAILTDTASGTGGNVIASFLLANARTPLVGDSLTAAGGAFTISFTT